MIWFIAALVYLAGNVVVFVLCRAAGRDDAPVVPPMVAADVWLAEEWERL